MGNGTRLNPAGQKGIALVIVMWMLVLLTVMAAGYSATMRTETRLTAQQLHSTQSRALAEAGVWLAVNDLLKPESSRKWNRDGTVENLKLLNGSVNLRIQDQSGLIDLNTARISLLQGLIKSVEPDDTRVSRIVNAILDWRDRDHLTRINGAEDADYRLDGFAYGSKDGPFNSIDELRKVMGMTETIYSKVKPALTIYSHMSGINPEFANREVLLAIPGIDPGSIDQYLENRSDTAALTNNPKMAGAGSSFTSTSKGVSFMISSTGNVDNTKVELEVVISLRRTSKQPYTILSWREI